MHSDLMICSLLCVQSQHSTTQESFSNLDQKCSGEQLCITERSRLVKARPKQLCSDQDFCSFSPHACVQSQHFSRGECCSE